MATDAALVSSAPLETFHQVYAAPTGVLEGLLARGEAPPFEDLVGWEFAGLNVGAIAGGFGLNRKFVKGFYEGPARASGPEPFVQGYNCPVKQDGALAPHRTVPSDESPKRFGFYRVFSARQSARHNRYPNALLLDYSLGGNGALSPPSVLRDYLVRVHKGRSELLLGKAYVALGPVTFVGGFFVLERLRKHAFTG